MSPSHVGGPAPEYWVFEGHVSGRHMIGDLSDWRTDFYVQRIFDAFHGKRIRITVEVLPEPPTDGRTSRYAVGDRVEQFGGPGEVPVGTLGRVDAFSEVGEDLYAVNWDGIGVRWWPKRYLGRTSSEGGQREP